MTPAAADREPLTPFLKPETVRLRPVAALRAFGRLMRDKEDTSQVFAIMRALSGRSIEKGYERLLRDPEGARQAYRALELVERLGDRAWLEAFPEGTLGAAYRAFMRGHGFEADGLNKADDAWTGGPLPHPRAWYARRLRDVHDVWHVLAGYDTDALGEACVVSFSFAQTRQLGFAVIGLGGAREIEREDPGVPAVRAVMEAWRNGRRAAWLPAQDYEALFALPLDEARRRLNIRPPEVYRSVPEARRRALKLRAAA